MVEEIEHIAIIGLGARLPGAQNIDQFWHNLSEGIDSISRFSDDELRHRGVSEKTINDPNFVKAGTVLRGVDLFDASFFGYNSFEAAMMDPQHRIFLEIAWEALENAGYDSERYKGAIGVFAGTSGNDYRKRFKADNPGIASGLELMELMIANDADFLTTRVSYKLNLKGPSLTIQTACSTSLVAVHLACQNLLAYQCDMALAGGVCIRFPQGCGYKYQEGMIMSPDGYCRPFDAKAQGTLFGHGAGLVVLKRLSEALEDRDTILAVIKGSAINNDGAMKVGFTAPSVNGQAEVISMAMAVGDIDPETISYIEAHGTATTLGDPIEVEALTQAFRLKTAKTGYCAIGSVKSNIGHMDIAAGVAGLIKTVLALINKKIPPTLHYSSPNPNIDFANSPFYVNTTLRDWVVGNYPRRAGVSSFGIGGTNAHIVLEEAPPSTKMATRKSWHLLTLSGRSDTVLDTMTANLVEHLKVNKEVQLADVAFTLQNGRKKFNHRKAVVCSSIDDAVIALSENDSSRVFKSIAEAANCNVIFMFSGQGAQYINMYRDLYLGEPHFKNTVNQCIEVLKPHLGLDLGDVLFPQDDKAQEAAAQINQTEITQPALFVIEYALAKFWNYVGIIPSALVGHSIGEYVAACISGVFSLEDALKLVATRGRLMASLPSGSMLALPFNEKDIQPYLSEGISLAVLNGASMSVVSGKTGLLEDLRRKLSEKAIEGKMLHTSHAFHSDMMDPILKDFEQIVADVNRNVPSIPFVSNVTGTWITKQQAIDPVYWSTHLRQTVQFSECSRSLLEKYPQGLFLEVGPGQTLSFLIKQHPASTKEHGVFASGRRPVERKNDVQYFLTTLGRLWGKGAAVEWNKLYEHENWCRIPLPTYPFERRRHWVDDKRELDQEDGYCHSKNHQSNDGQDREQKRTSNDKDENSNTGEFLIGLWKELIGVENIKIDDDFFELGGDSLTALHLFVQIERRLNIRLPLATLYEAPTIEKLTTILNDKRYSARWDSLVAIQPEGSRPPLFFIHSEGGNVLEYNDLSQYLGSDQPFYALQAKGLEQGFSVHKTIEEMASSYLEEIRKVQSEGPYLLGGYCLGGLIAYQVAQQLIADGEKISLLFLVSTYNPQTEKRAVNAIGPLQTAYYRVVQRCGLEWSNLSFLSKKAKADYLWSRFHKVVNVVQVQAEKIINSLLLKIGREKTSHSLAFKLKMFADAQNRAFFNYVPQEISCNVRVFRAIRQSSFLFPDENLGWTKLLVNDLQRIDIDAYHKNILKKPNVKQLAEELTKCINSIL